MNEPAKKKKKFSLNKTIQQTGIMPEAIKDKPNKGRYVLIIFLTLLPILIGLISYLLGV